ncbi:MAG: hypothetical protein MUF40_02330 [Gemmatimonadaceae bacterium]|jgi:3-deoxy-D-manno-octulosonic acid kinase|nr:hypothetical protein [Gemmatimonadaceae bacterium]
MLVLRDVGGESLAGSPVATPGGLVPAGMLPAGWQETPVGETLLVAHGSVLDEAAALVEAHGSLHRWAGRQPGAEAMQGRTTAWATTLPESGLPVVVRHSAHGGLLAPLTGDRFRRPRAPDELRLSWTLRQVGVPTPRVLAYTLHPVWGGLFRRADVMTQRVVGARDLVAVLRTATDAESVAAVAATVETLLTALRTTHARHPDLNLKNILLAPGDDGTPVAWVLDIDTLRFADPEAGVRNRARLVRSARKWARASGAAAARAFSRFAAALAERSGR